VKKVTDIDISLLVNNVGVMYPGLFSDIPISQVKETVDVNIVPAVMLTKCLLDKLLARPLRSGVISLSS